MRILLAAYEFPPTPSPQSLRWAYLVRELALLGHEVIVIAPDVPGYGSGGLPEVPGSVAIRRVSPGLIHRLVAGRRGVRDAARSVPNSSGPGGASCDTVKPENSETDPALNWKGRLASVVAAVAAELQFPDHRASWLPYARRELRQIVLSRRPDIVVVSHEPACALPLAFTAARLGVPWTADLGDPVLAAYTPKRWRRRACRLERDICSGAGFLSVTTTAAASLLAERHGTDPGRFMIIPQGFDDQYVARTQERMIRFESGALELLYTGSFYDFRRADSLVRAVLETEGTRLTVATIAAPAYLLDAASAAPEKVRIVGFLPHRSALAAQRECDILVNIANDDPVQIPGKFFEYLGSRRPILNIGSVHGDGVHYILAQSDAGWTVGPDTASMVSLLRSLVELKSTHGVIRGTCSNVDEYSWKELARGWVERATKLLEHPETVRLRNSGFANG